MTRRRLGMAAASSRPSPPWTVRSSVTTMQRVERGGLGRCAVSRKEEEKGLNSSSLIVRKWDLPRPPNLSYLQSRQSRRRRGMRPAKCLTNSADLHNFRLILRFFSLALSRWCGWELGGGSKLAISIPMGQNRNDHEGHFWTSFIFTPTSKFTLSLFTKPCSSQEWMAKEWDWLFPSSSGKLFLWSTGHLLT